MLLSVSLLLLLAICYIVENNKRVYYSKIIVNKTDFEKNSQSLIELLACGLYLAVIIIIVLILFCV